jgi:hypothetical protein
MATKTPTDNYMDTTTKTPSGKMLYDKIFNDDIVDQYHNKNLNENIGLELWIP